MNYIWHFLLLKLDFGTKFQAIIKFSVTVLVFEPINHGCGFESRYSHLNLRYCTCFKGGVSWHILVITVQIHSKGVYIYHKNTQSNKVLYCSRKGNMASNFHFFDSSDFYELGPSFKVSQGCSNIFTREF